MGFWYIYNRQQEKKSIHLMNIKYLEYIKYLNINQNSNY